MSDAQNPLPPYVSTDPQIVAERAYVDHLAATGKLTALLNRRDTTPLVAMWASDKAYLTTRESVNDAFYKAGFDVVVPFNIEHKHKGHGDSTLEGVVAIDYDTYNEKGQRQPTIIVAFRGTSDVGDTRAVEDKRAADGWVPNDETMEADYKLVPMDDWPDNGGSKGHEGMKIALDLVRDGWMKEIDRMKERSYAVSSLPPRIIFTGHSAGAQLAADLAVREANRDMSMAPQDRPVLGYFGYAAPAYLNAKAAAYARPRLDVAQNYLINGVMVTNPHTGKVKEEKPDLIDEIRTTNHDMHQDDCRPIGTQVLMANDAVPLGPKATSTQRHSPENYVDNVTHAVFSQMAVDMGLAKDADTAKPDLAAIDAALAPAQANTSALAAARQLPETPVGISAELAGPPTAVAEGPGLSTLREERNQVTDASPPVLTVAPQQQHGEVPAGPDGYDADRPLPDVEIGALIPAIIKIITSPLRAFHIENEQPRAADSAQLPVQQTPPAANPFPHRSGKNPW